MKVVLLTDVKGSGKAGEVVDVNDGYARNFLLPHKKAVIADAQSLAVVKQKNDARIAREAKEKATAEELKKVLDNTVVEVKVKCGEGDRTYGSVTTQDIANGVAALGYAVDKKKIVLSENIRTLGTYTVDVKVYANMTAKLRINVTRA